MWTCMKTRTWYAWSCCLFCKIHEKQLCHTVTKMRHSSMPSKWSSQFYCTKIPLGSHCHNSPGRIPQGAVAGLGRGMSPEGWQNVLWNSPKLNGHWCDTSLGHSRETSSWWCNKGWLQSQRIYTQLYQQNCAQLSGARLQRFSEWFVCWHITDQRTLPTPAVSYQQLAETKSPPRALQVPQRHLWCTAISYTQPCSTSLQCCHSSQWLMGDWGHLRLPGQA